MSLVNGKSRDLRYLWTSAVPSSSLKTAGLEGTRTSGHRPLAPVPCSPTHPRSSLLLLRTRPPPPPQSKRSVCFKSTSIESGKVGIRERRQSPSRDQILRVFSLLLSGKRGAHPLCLHPAAPVPVLGIEAVGAGRIEK